MFFLADRNSARTIAYNLRSVNILRAVCYTTLMQSKSKTLFDALYKKLNPEQKKAVDAIEGPVMVLAGPGTGKTHMLTLRIANILRLTDTAPENILALTFTESAVYAMRKRLVEIIGARGYRVRIHTFHGFCNDVIKDYPEHFERIIGASHIGEIEQARLIEDMLLSTRLTMLKPYGSPLYYVPALLSSIRQLKREDYTPADFKKFLEKETKVFEAADDLYYTSGRFKGRMKGKYSDTSTRLKKSRELSLVYEKYQRELGKRHRYDYEDMIMEVVRTLSSDPNLLLALQEQYQYILADEHQDANNAQNELLTLLASFHDNPNLFIVGDDKQAIYRFQGASVENFLSFKRRYPEALVVDLKKNYRSTQTILDAAHALISASPQGNREHVRLVSALSRAGKKVLVFALEHEDDEPVFVARDIAKKIASGIAPSAIAVLYRDNKDAFPLSRALAEARIPSVIHSEQDALVDEDIGKLLRLLRAIDNPADDALLAEALLMDFVNLEPFDVYALIQAGREKKMPLCSLMANEKALIAAGVLSPSSLSFFAAKLSLWSREARNRELIEFFEAIIAASGFLGYLLNRSDAPYKLGALTALFNEAKRLAAGEPDCRLAGFLSHLDTLREHHLRLPAHSDAGVSGVNLLTAHRAKGLEFEHVYITRVVEGHWGSRRRGNHFMLPSVPPASFPEGENADERRLFYVALTRARTGVTMSVPQQGEERTRLLPSPFLEDIGDTHVFRRSASVPGCSFPERLPVSVSSAVSAPLPSALNKEYLNARFLEQGLSVTALNNYLECPWKYFFNNLVRIPSVETKQQLYGIAVHQTLKQFFDALREGRVPSKKTLLALFEKSLRRVPLGEAAFEESLSKGEKALGGYYGFYKPRFIVPLKNEFSIAGVFAPVDCGDGTNVRVLLRGVLDKIEEATGEAGERERISVNVVDYKTSRPKSRNALEGKTDASNGNEKRQLVFYKLLLDRYQKGREGREGEYAMVSGEIDFVEPDPRGRYRKEKFFITDADVGALKHLVREVAREILALAFWDRYCGKNDCEHCALRRMMKK